MVWKKDIMPFAKGGAVIKHKGKGASEYTGGDRFGREMNRYPKPSPGPGEKGPTELGLGNAYEFRRKP